MSELEPANAQIPETARLLALDKNDGLPGN
jgi:hypothetical protein